MRNQYVPLFYSVRCNQINEIKENKMILNVKFTNCKCIYLAPKIVQGTVLNVFC